MKYPIDIILVLKLRFYVDFIAMFGRYQTKEAVIRSFVVMSFIPLIVGMFFMDKTHFSRIII